MKNLKKVIALSMAGIMAAGALAACSDDSGSKTSNSGGGSTSTESKADTAPESKVGDGGDASKGRVYWLNFKPESDAVLQEIAKTYTEQTKVPVKVVTAASGTYEDQLTSELGKNEPPTMFVIGNPEKAAKWGSYAADLRGSKIADELTTDAYNLYGDDGKLVSIGYCYEAYGIIVNTDLLTQANHSLDEIKNFDTLKTVVEDIHSRAAELGFDAFTSCDMDPSSSWRFTCHMANLEYFYEEKEAGSKWTKTPESISGKYLPNFKNLYDLCINNSISKPNELASGGHDASQQFKDKKAAFTVQGSWEYSGYKEAGINASMIPYYCGVEGEEGAGLNCGTENCWAINAKVSADDQAATQDFMVWCVTNADASKKLVESFGVMPYKSAAESTNGFLKNSSEYDAKNCYVMDWATNYQPNVDEYRATLVSALNAYNSDQSDANWDKVKTAFVDGWAIQYAAVNG